MRVLLLITLWLAFSMQPSATVTASNSHVGLGETITYVITVTEMNTWANVTLPEEMIITATTPDCIVQPLYSAYCVLDNTDTLTITARLDRLPCRPLNIDIVVADVTHVQGPDVVVSPQTCIYLPIVM